MDDELEISAYHEAGHAWMAYRVGAQVRSVTVEPDWDDGPERHADTQVGWPADWLERPDLCERFIWVAIAGPVAEMIYRGDRFHPGLVPEWAQDWKQAWWVASRLHPAEHPRLRYLEQITIELHALLSDDRNWSILAALVDNLLAQETLEAAEVEELLSQWMPRR